MDQGAAGDAQGMLQFLAEHTSDVIVRIDRQGLVTYVSPSCRMYGHAPEDIVGTNGLALFHPEDRERIARHTADVFAGERSEAVDHEYRFRLPDGGWIWVESNPSVIAGPDGRPEAFATILRNVTRRRAAQDDLRQSEARHRLIAETMHDLIVQTDPDWRISYVSPSVRSFGFKPDDLIGRGVDEFMHPDDQQRVQESRRRAYAGEGKAPSSERAMRFRTADGKWVWLEGRPQLLRSADGKPLGMLNVLRDVTERRAQAQVFEAAFNNAPVAMTMIALDNTFLRVNPVGCAMLGVSEAELVGRNASEFVHPDDVGLNEPGNARLLAGEITAHDGQRRFRRADGSYVWAHLSISLVRDADGAPRHYISHAQDLTARREAEAALSASEARRRTIAEKTSDLIVMSDPEGRITYASPSVRLLGYEPDELIGTTFAPHTHPDDAGRVWRALKDQAAGAPLERIRWRARHKQSGAWVWMESAPTTLRDPQTGAATGHLDVVRDISIQVAQEEALAQARADAEAAAGVKSQFLANMSHEIRTPLTAVLGYTDLLAATPGLNDKARTYVKRIAGGGAALLAIVNDILDFSKLEAGRVEIRPQPTVLADLVEQTMALFEGRAAEKGLALTWMLDPTLPESVMLDSDRLRQILVNLAGNAVKFTDRGAVSVRLARDPADGRLRLEVEDSGPGLDAEQCDRLFQRFNQIDGSTTRRHGGTGLGLAICKGLAEAMGGEIGVSSVPGVGSVFHLVLPLEPVETVRIEAADTACIAGLRVMVVDDNATNRELARRILEAFGAEVMDADGGESALAQLAALPVDAVLMDLRMPGLDGREALSRLRAAEGPNRDAPVLAFTADADVGQSDGLEPFDGLVRKPIEPLALVAALAEAAAPLAAALAERQAELGPEEPARGVMAARRRRA